MGISSGDQHRVAVFAPLFPPAFRGGGPIRSIEALVAQSPKNFQVSVLTNSRDLGQSCALPVDSDVWINYADSRVMYATLGSLKYLLRALRAVRRSKPELLHINSFFNPRVSILPVLLWRFGFWGQAPLLLSPRGEFGAGAMRRRPWKKTPYVVLFRLLSLHKRVIWHSTAPHETADIEKRWGRENLLIERQNDTLLPLNSRRPEVPAGDSLRAVFLGRIVEHKGLAIALEALQHLTHPIEFDVFGSREDESYAILCEELARHVSMNVTVRFHGAVEPADVAGIMARHDVLLMPTAGENFGHVIAEALSESCVVVTTPDTPWTDVLIDGGGAVVPRQAEAWARVITDLAAEGSERRETRREQAGGAYDRWANKQREPHVWSQVAERLGGRNA